MSGKAILAAILIAVCFAQGAVAKMGVCKLYPDSARCDNVTVEQLPQTPNEQVKRLSFVRISFPVLKQEHLKSFPRLTHLFVEENSLENIDDDAFAGLSDLEWFTAASNKLTTVSPDIFKNCPRMKYLELSGNADFVLPENAPFLNSDSIDWLEMQRMNLKTLYSETFKNLPELETLSLSENELATLPDDVFYPLKKLQKLELEGNRFTTLPMAVFQNMNNVLLGLSDNPWECDCNSYPFIQWANKQRLRDNVYCAKPERKDWDDVQLNCPVAVASS